MKRISWLLIVMFCLSVVMSGLNPMGNMAVAADTLRVAKITEVHGDVQVLRAGGEKTFTAFKGMGLTQGDTIITGKDGRVTLELAEDKELKIGENSRVIISELVQSQEDNADKTSLNLKAGQVYTNVKSKLSPNAKYEIRTPTAVMGVRGTQFFVSLASGGQAKVVTLEGRVFVTVPQQVTREDGSTITQEVEIEVQANQIFVQTGEGAEPDKYDLDTLTGDEELSLFVLEVLQEISQQQPELINPKILQNLEEKIEQARQEQLEQQRQQEQQQEELRPNIQYDNNTGGQSESPSGSSRRNDPKVVINTELDDIFLHVDGEPWIYFIETTPAEDVELAVEVEDESVAEAAFDGNALFIYGLGAGSTNVTVTARKEGYTPAQKSFAVIVYELGSWTIMTIDEREYPLEDIDLALDHLGMPHVTYKANGLKYQYWEGSQWKMTEEVHANGSQGDLVMRDFPHIVFVADNDLMLADLYGEKWEYWPSSSGEAGQVRNPAVAYAVFPAGYGENNIEIGITAVSFYDAVNGDLYLSFNQTEPVKIAGNDSDAGQYSAPVISYYNDETQESALYVAYYDYKPETGTGALKLVPITVTDIWSADPEIVVGETEEIDAQPGRNVGQFVSLAEFDGELHAAYYDSTNGALKYAVRREGEWSITTVDSEGNAGQYASLALDSDGFPYISYYVETPEGDFLKYASPGPENEGQWYIESVDFGEETGKFCSLALDNNIPHIAYAAKEGGYWTVKYTTIPGALNSIFPAEIWGEVETFTDLIISNWWPQNTFISAVHDEYGELIEGEDIVIELEGQIISLKANFLNSLGAGLHRIWFNFDFGTPGLLTIKVYPPPESYSPDLAYDPENNRYLLVYESFREDTTYISGRFLTAAGEEIEDFVIHHGSEGREPAVVRNGLTGDYLVTWWVCGEEETGQIWARIYDEYGQPKGEAFRVSSNGGFCPTVAYNSASNEYLIAWEQDGGEVLGREIRGQRLSQNGDLLGEELELISRNGNQGEPVLAYSGLSGKYLLAATCDADGNAIIGRLLDEDGTPVSAILNISGTSGELHGAPDVVYDEVNGRFVVVWYDSGAGYLADIYGRFITDSGLLGAGFMVPGGGGFKRNPSIALRQVEDTVSYLVAWEEEIESGNWQVYIVWIGENGEILSAKSNVHSDSSVSVMTPSAAYNSQDDNCLIAYAVMEDYRFDLGYKLEMPIFETSNAPELEDITVLNLVTHPDFWTTDKVIVKNVPPNAAVRVYASLGTNTPLASGQMPSEPESSELIISIEGGFPVGAESVWVSITEEGKAESDRVEVEIPTPLMSEGVDFAIDDIEVGSGKVKFIITAEQVAAMEEATGKTISLIMGFVGQKGTSFDDLVDLDGGSVQMTEITVPVFGESSSTIQKEIAGNYPCAIVVFDSEGNEIAYYLGKIDVYFV